jgi:formate hydrogenlyase subunit 3/multisubunit Na+/H+ antiporter MnhD subunit
MDWSLFTLLLIMMLVPLVCIFLYKRRWLQLRFLIFSSILNLLFYALFFFEKGQHTQWILTESGTQGPADITYNYILLAMPVLGVFCDVMAMRGVLRDIALLKSLERLR